jgi:hypothetical protein
VIPPLSWLFLSQTYIAAQVYPFHRLHATVLSLLLDTCFARHDIRMLLDQRVPAPAETRTGLHFSSIPMDTSQVDL